MRQRLRAFWKWLTTPEYSPALCRLHTWERVEGSNGPRLRCSICGKWAGYNGNVNEGWWG